MLLASKADRNVGGGGGPLDAEAFAAAKQADAEAAEKAASHVALHRVADPSASRVIIHKSMDK